MSWPFVGTTLSEPPAATSGGRWQFGSPVASALVVQQTWDHAGDTGSFGAHLATMATFIQKVWDLYSVVSPSVIADKVALPHLTRDGSGIQYKPVNTPTALGATLVILGMSGVPAAGADLRSVAVEAVKLHGGAEAGDGAGYNPPKPCARAWNDIAWQAYPTQAGFLWGAHVTQVADRLVGEYAAGTATPVPTMHQADHVAAWVRYLTPGSWTPADAHAMVVETALTLCLHSPPVSWEADDVNVQVALQQQNGAANVPSAVRAAIAGLAHPPIPAAAWEADPASEDETGWLSWRPALWEEEKKEDREQPAPFARTTPPAYDALDARLRAAMREWAAGQPRRGTLHWWAAKSNLTERGPPPTGTATIALSFFLDAFDVANATSGCWWALAVLVHKVWQQAACCPFNAELLLPTVARGRLEYVAAPEALGDAVVQDDPKWAAAALCYVLFGAVHSPTVDKLTTSEEVPLDTWTSVLCGLAFGVSKPDPGTVPPPVLGPVVATRTFADMRDDDRTEVIGGATAEALELVDGHLPLLGRVIAQSDFHDAIRHTLVTTLPRIASSPAAILAFTSYLLAAAECVAVWCVVWPQTTGAQALEFALKTLDWDRDLLPSVSAVASHLATFTSTPSVRLNKVDISAMSALTDGAGLLSRICRLPAP